MFEGCEPEDLAVELGDGRTNVGEARSELATTSTRNCGWWNLLRIHRKPPAGDRTRFSVATPTVLRYQDPLRETSDADR